MTVVYEENDPHAFSREERRAIEEVAAQTIPDVRRLLPRDFGGASPPWRSYPAEV